MADRNLKKITFTESDTRRAVAHHTVIDYGASYLNSLVGSDAAETCKNIEAIMPFMKRTIDERSADELDDMRPVLSFLMLSIWTAVQYETEVSDHG